VIVPLRGAPGRLILAGVPWVTSLFPSTLVDYNREILSKLDCLVLYTNVTPDFTRKTECISRVRQDQFTHI
jgi:hypothetical protein